MKAVIIFLDPCVRKQTKHFETDHNSAPTDSICTATIVSVICAATIFCPNSDSKNVIDELVSINAVYRLLRLHVQQLGVSVLEEAPGFPAGSLDEHPDLLHSWTCILSNQLCVNGYHGIVRVCRSQWILTETLQATKDHMMNINQHMCKEHSGEHSQVPPGGKPANAFISHQYNGCRMGAGCCIPRSQEQLAHTLNITTNLTTELRYRVTDGTSVSPARKKTENLSFFNQLWGKVWGSESFCHVL